MSNLKKESIKLLESLIKCESYSGQEENTAQHIKNFLQNKGIRTTSLFNNIIARNRFFDANKKTIVLNSHHDTVQIVEGWTKDPFAAQRESGKLYGLGSNDAGASLVSLIATFIHYYEVKLPFNLLLVASGEEENSGPKGVRSVLDQLEFDPYLAVIGEPTEMQMATAEKGLIVVDGTVTGRSGHAARESGENAIYKAIKDINRIATYSFPKISDTLGKVKMTVTQIHAGTQHNVIPDVCRYVIDIRVNELYKNEEIVDILQTHCSAELVPRSLKWQASGIDTYHPIVQKGVQLGRHYFGSPTLSDQVHFKCPSLKIGPGKSERSHTADEFVKITEIEEGIDIYIQLFKNLVL